MSTQLKDNWIIVDEHYVAMLLHANLKSFYIISNKRERAIKLLKLKVNELLDSVVVQPFQTSVLNNKAKNKVKKGIYSLNSLR
jgi:hypothetical protein